MKKVRQAASFVSYHLTSYFSDLDDFPLQHELVQNPLELSGAAVKMKGFVLQPFNTPSWHLQRI